MELHTTKRRGIKEEILKLRKKGLSYRDIQSKLKCSKSTINYHCKNHDLTDTGLKLFPISQKVKNAIKKFTKTHTKKEAMSEFGVGRTTIKNYKTKL